MPLGISVQFLEYTRKVHKFMWPFNIHALLTCKWSIHSLLRCFHQKQIIPLKPSMLRVYICVDLRIKWLILKSVYDTCNSNQRNCNKISEDQTNQKWNQLYTDTSWARKTIWEKEKSHRNSCYKLITYTAMTLLFFIVIFCLQNLCILDIGVAL